MKKLILVFFLSISLGVMSQDFAPPGSSWHYTSISGIPIIYSYCTFDYAGDTIIESRPCSILQQSGYNLTDTFPFARHYCHSRNDSVFFYDMGMQEFYLLYDFNANGGDTILLQRYSGGFGEPLRVVVDSTGQIDHNGKMRKIQYVRTYSTTWDFGHQIIEGIGSTSYLYPCADFTFYGPLRCYSDTTNGLFLNSFYTGPGWNMQDCDQMIVSTEEIQPADDILIYPNPSKDRVTLENIEFDSELICYSINGGYIFDRQLCEGTNSIDISDLQPGVYFFKISNNKTSHNYRVVKSI